jgi:acetylornithine deacetylase
VALKKIVNGAGELQEMLHTPALHMEAMEGFTTTVVAYTTDIPNFQGAWGKPLLIGPGSIHVAHTAEERIPKQQILEAIELYTQLTQRLLAKASPQGV